MNNRTEPSTHTTPRCPTWCTVDHNGDTGAYHCGDPVLLAKAETGQEYVAYLEQHFDRPGTDANIAIVQDPGPWKGVSLGPALVEHLLQAFDDGGEQAMQALGGLLVQGRQPRVWWKDASNPECPSWCSEDHEADEFSSTSTILHRSAPDGGGTAEAGFYTSRVQMVTAEDEPGEMSVAYDHVEIDLEPSLDLQLATGEGLPATVEQVLPIARALVAKFEAAS